MPRLLHCCKAAPTLVAEASVTTDRAALEMGWDSPTTWTKRALADAKEDCMAGVQRKAEAGPLRPPVSGARTLAAFLINNL